MHRHPIAPHPTNTPARFRLPVAALCLWGILMLAGPSGSAMAAEPLVVAAAASFQPSLRLLAEAWEAGGGAPLRLVFGASGRLAMQIRSGAPYDLFLSADEGWLRRLEGEGLLAPGTVSFFAEGVLALAVHRAHMIPMVNDPEAPPMDARALQVLRRADFRMVGIANPRHAPYGLAAMEVLRHAGLAEPLAGRLVHGADVRQTLTFLETGNVEAALVAAPLLVNSALPWREVAANLHTPLRQGLAIIKATGNGEQARTLRAWLLGDDAARVFRRHGYRAVGQPAAPEQAGGGRP